MASLGGLLDAAERLSATGTLAEAPRREAVAAAEGGGEMSRVAIADKAHDLADR